MSIKVMIADDHVLMREGVKQLLEYDGSIKVISEAADGVECLKILETVTPDILLLDINMPNKNGIEVLEDIKNKNIDIKILILSRNVYVLPPSRSNNVHPPKSLLVNGS